MEHLTILSLTALFPVSFYWIGVYNHELFWLVCAWTGFEVIERLRRA